MQVPEFKPQFYQKKSNLKQTGSVIRENEIWKNYLKVYFKCVENPKDDIN
jgi:hypothetical protein